MTTLEEALRDGQGTERPFRCPSHEDKHASASINVLKGVWYCYACHASGGVDKKHVPTADDLLSMLEPDKTVRVYPEPYLDLFDISDAGPGFYWPTRFPRWLCWWARLGNDPFTGHATFPVRTPNGFLAGVGRRDPDPEAQPKYKYPFGWSAASVLGGTDLIGKTDHVVLVEGYADACSLWEVGIPALTTFGAGLHYPQLEALFRLGPKKVLHGFDMDNAGEAAVTRSWSHIEEVIHTQERVEWPEKDPAECSPEQRIAAVQLVAGREYVQQWKHSASQWRETFLNHDTKEHADA